MVLGAVVAGGADAPAKGKADRLGIRFDPRIREAAVATAKAPDGLAADEAPAGVVRLPKLVVKEELLRMRPEEMLTPEGRVETAKARYLNVGYQKTLGRLAAVAALLNNPLGGWNPNTPEAMALYEDDEQKFRNSEMRGLVELQALSDELKKRETKPTPKKK